MKYIKLDKWHWKEVIRRDVQNIVMWFSKYVKNIRTSKLKFQDVFLTFWHRGSECHICEYLLNTQNDMSLAWKRLLRKSYCWRTTKNYVKANMWDLWTKETVLVPGTVGQPHHKPDQAGWKLSEKQLEILLSLTTLMPRGLTCRRLARHNPHIVRTLCCRSCLWTWSGFSFLIFCFQVKLYETR